ncbi:aspartate aminotransferase, cytoplasmic [Aspergillus varians]
MEQHPFDELPHPELESLNALQAQYQQDPSPLRVDLLCGVYRTDEGKPYVLPAVQQARNLLYQNPDWNHEYPVSHLGTPRFRDLTAQLLFGEDNIYVKDRRVASMQTLGGSGACHMGAVFLNKHYGPWNAGAPRKVYIPAETWNNHPNVFRYLDIEVDNLPYYDHKTGTVAFDELKGALERLPNQAVIVLQPAANNPTGSDLSQEQWHTLADLFKRKGHFPFFDAAYLGFVSGDHQKDSAPLQLFLERNIPFLCALSYGKSFGLYGERVGVLSIPTYTPDLARRIESHMKLLARAETGAMPLFGSMVVECILGNEELRIEWKNNLRRMAEDLKQRRQQLWVALSELETPGDWSFITQQAGMFSYMNLNTKHIDMLRETYHVYLQDTGRLSVAGLNGSNIRYVAQSINSVLRYRGS